MHPSSRERLIQENSLAHDIREINRHIKTASERLCEQVKRHRDVLRNCDDLASKIFFASEMITKRLDVFQFISSNRAINTTERTYRVHRVIVKLLKILNEKTNARSLSVDLSDSYVEVTSSLMFETALFVVLENFIKYTPERERVSVCISENVSSKSIAFEAYGPLLTSEEKGRLFQFGMRGRMAKKMSNNDGSGMGLYFAKQICNLHGFNLSMSQNSARSVSRSGIDYHWTSVNIDIPRQ